MNPYAINPRAYVRPADAPEDKKPDDENPVPDGNPEEKLSRAGGPAIDGQSPEEMKLLSLMKEISWSEQDVLQAYLPFANNPDPIVRSKGLRIYREMAQDDQVKVCLDVRAQARLSTPWEIMPGTAGNAQSEEMAKFIDHVLRRMRGNFESDLEQIYTAVQYGFSISEKIFDYIEDGKFKGKIGLRAIKTREPFNYDFKIDAHGNLLGLVYVGMTGTDSDNDGRGGAIPPQYPQGMIMPSTTISKPMSPARGAQLGTLENPFPPEKFVIYSYNQQFGNFYGRSDLLAAFKWWLMKKHGSKFWAVWLERYASPFLVAQYKRDAGLKRESLLAIDDFLRNLSTRQGVRVSDAVTITPVQFSGTGADSYEKAIEAFNRYIAHALIFPNLIGFTGGQGSSGGSYSLGQKQFDAFVWILEKMGRDTSETIVGEQIIKALIKINFGEVDSEMMPKFRFVSIEDAKIEVRSKILEILTRIGVVNYEEEWVRNFLTIPKKDPGVVLAPAKDPNADPNNPGGEGKPGEKKGGGNVPDNPNSTKKKPAEEEPAPKKDEKKDMTQFKEREPNSFEEKMRVKEFQAELDSFDDGLFKEASQAIEIMRDELIDKVQKKRMIEDGDAAVVSTITVNPKRLKETLERWMVKAFLDSKLRMLEELERGGYQVQIVKKFAAGMQPWEPLPPREAIDFFRRKVLARVVMKDGKRKLIDITEGTDLTFFQQKAFSVAGIVRDDILNDAKQIILNGIKRQDQIGAVKDLKDMFNRYLDQGVEVDEELISPSRLNTIVRTNITEAVNEGRASMMRNENVGNFVQFFEYTAIMDQRTTDYCACMDGKFFRIEDLDMLRPPAHFNCRSFTVPVTAYELEEMKDGGRGVEVSEPCPDRAAGFSDQKREPIELPAERPPAVPKVVPAAAPAPSQDRPAAPPAPIDKEAMEKLKEELSQIVARCPYATCHSDKIRFTGMRMNVGEYACDACRLPFRISSTGDLYLYDAGTDVWSRQSMGLMPLFFREKRN